MWAVGNVMVIFLAAVLDVPRQLYEAAEIDGAGAWQRLRHITLPAISPVILFAVVIGVIEGLQYFTQAYVASQIAVGQASQAGSVSTAELGYPLGLDAVLSDPALRRRVPAVHDGLRLGADDGAAGRGVRRHVRDRAPLAQLDPLRGRAVIATVRRRRLLVAVGRHSLLIAGAAIFLMPFVFIILTSLMTTDQALSDSLWPDPFQPSNYRRGVPPGAAAALDAQHRRSTPGSARSACWSPASRSPTRSRSCAGAAVRRPFLVVLVALMLPPQVSVVPLYVMWSKLHLVGTLWPLILPNWLGDAFTIFLLRQFFLTIPDEYLDAARVDGCGELRVLFTVVLRLARPAIAAVAMFSVLYTFNDFFLPLLYVGEKPDNWVVSIGLSQFRNLHQVQWNLTMAATLLVMLPVIILFFAAQKAFVEGITLTGVKG